MDFKFDRLTVQEQTAAKLRDAILAGYFSPGQRLVESNLCALLKVSRTTLREALRGLQAEKLVTIVANKGPSVAELSWSDAEQIYEVRAMLEGEAAALFAGHATAGHKQRMRSALQAFVRADKAGDAMGRLRSTGLFYAVILEGCGNRIIGEVLDGLLARITFLRARSMSRAGRAKSSAAEMHCILAAIEANDSAGARAAAIDHVRAACAAARENFSVREAA